MSSRINRRSFLKGVGGVAVALPFLETLAPSRAHAADGVGPKRMVTWFTACGTIPENHWCTGDTTLLSGSDTGSGMKLGERKTFELSRILAPLERHKSDLLILEHLRMGGNGYSHSEAMPIMMVGRENIKGTTCEQTAAGKSLDVEIGESLVDVTRFPTFYLGINITPDGERSGGPMSWLGPNQPIMPRNNPYQAFADLFGDLPSSTDNAEALARRMRRKVSLLDSVLANLNALAGRVSASDRLRLEAHTEAIRAIEIQLETPAPVETCGAPEVGTPIDWTANDNAPLVGKLHMDIMAVALACDLTRVGTIQFARAGGSGRRHNWIAHPSAKSGDWHGVSHDPDNQVEGLTQINTWYSGQLAYFIDKLKAMQDGAGSVFDNTVVFVTNEYGPLSHHHQDLPILLAGSCGGQFKLGRCLRYQNNSSARHNHTFHNRLLISLKNAMGLPGSFGDETWGNTPLAELTNVT